MGLRVLFFLFTFAFGAMGLPKGFVDLSSVDAGILVDARYNGPHNFVGRKINGYRTDKCILSTKAAKALSGAQKEFLSLGYTIKVYDCFRPQRAVDDFVSWAKNLPDTKMKEEFYPNVKKKNLFRNGYIARKSGHSRGATVDLTLVKIPPKEQAVYTVGQRLRSCTGKDRFADSSIDMGTGYDCFDPLSHTANPNVSPHAQKNRKLLKTVMERHGFKNYRKEWWHYTLKEEPFPNRYFDFEIN